MGQTIKRPSFTLAKITLLMEVKKSMIFPIIAMWKESAFFKKEKKIKQYRFLAN